jgi:LAGLIDADG DNA endonuclease family protein
VKLATEAPVNGGRNYEPLVVIKSGYMLENLSIRRYSPASAGSDNLSGAGNQQERPAARMSDLDQIPDHVGFYFAGFVDGEGSFNLSFRKRTDYKLPWKVSLCLNVSQKDRSILALLQQYLGCGTIRYKSDGVWFFEVNNLGAICEHVIPFFDRFSFLSAKKIRDFAIFKRMADLMRQGAHLRYDGICTLLELRREMNDGGKRKYNEQVILAAFGTTESSETIRQTSETSEDDIVRPAWRHAEPGRNGPAQPQG